MRLKKKKISQSDSVEAFATCICLLSTCSTCSCSCSASCDCSGASKTSYNAFVSGRDVQQRVAQRDSTAAEEGSQRASLDM